MSHEPAQHVIGAPLTPTQREAAARAITTRYGPAAAWDIARALGLIDDPRTGLTQCPTGTKYGIRAAHRAAQALRDERAAADRAGAPHTCPTCGVVEHPAWPHEHPEETPCGSASTTAS